MLRVEPGAGSELGKQSTVASRGLQGQGAVCRPEARRRQGSATSGSALSPLTLRLGEQLARRGARRWPRESSSPRTPPRARRVKRATAVSVVVSKGREPIEVPTVTGAPFDAASAAITKAGLTVQRGQDVNSDTVPAGQVVSQSPDERHAAPRRRRDDRRVQGAGHGAGAQRRRPARDSDAEKTLTDLGFTVKKDYGLLGSSSRPRPGQSVQRRRTSAPKGSTIVLTIV